MDLICIQGVRLPYHRRTSPRLRLARESELKNRSFCGKERYREGRRLKYVFLIRNFAFSGQRTIGITLDIASQVEAQNEGWSFHTAKFKPWKLAPHIGLSNHDKALVFERYLKFGSGRAFVSSVSRPTEAFLL